MIRFLIVVVMAACTPATWQPSSNAETVKIEGDLIVRTESDGTISLSARVNLDDASAYGFVRLRNADVKSAATSKHVQLARARAWRVLAMILIAEPERSYRAAELGVEALRVRWVGNHESMRARAAAYNNNFPEAARRMAGSLHDSLRAYTRRFHDEVW